MTTLAPGPVPPVKPQTNVKSAEADPSAGLTLLLTIEKDAREARTIAELRHLMAHETRKITRARQIAVLNALTASPEVVALSGQPAVDRASPLVQGLERAVARLAKTSEASRTREFDLLAFAEAGGGVMPSYPFGSAVWAPLSSRAGQNLGGLLLTREQPWAKGDLLIIERLTSAYAHALSLLIAEPNLAARLKVRAKGARAALAGSALAALLLLALPVPMTVLAPFEITPANPVIISAPIEGVIDDILVEPSALVTAGQPLVRYNDTALRNRLEIAEREVSVAEARLKQATQMAFNDIRGRHEMTVTESERNLKAAERDYARDLFERALIKSPRAGVAVYADRKSFLGKPVVTGERLMQIADPAHVEVTIDVPVADAIALRPGAAIKLYFDSDPLNSREASVSEAEYQARPRPGNLLAYRVAGKLTAGGDPPRLGARGTAQIFGDRVSLAFYLFRRPVAAFRQWVGQ